MRELSSRTSKFTESVIRQMTRIANECDAINLSQGFPDFDPPKAILDRLAEVAYTGPHQYQVCAGAKAFRDAVAKKFEHFSGLMIDPESEIVVTCGSTEAMMASLTSVINPGDKVVIFSPFYENYGADAILSGAEPIRSFLAQNRLMCRLFRRISALIKKLWKTLLNKARRR